MKNSCSPATAPLACALLAPWAAVLLLHLHAALAAALDTPARFWPLDRPAAVVSLVVTVSALLLLLAGFVLLVLGLSRLLRDAFPSLRARLRIPWALLAALTGLWPLAAFLPAALRLRSRAAALLAVPAFLCGLVALAGFTCPTSEAAAAAASLLLDLGAIVPPSLPGLPLPPWATGLAAVLHTGLLLLALDRLRPSRRRIGPAIAAFAAIALLLLAFHPGSRSLDRLRRHSNDLLARLLERLGSPCRPDAPFPGILPPVPPEADPVAALDPEALRADASVVNALNLLLGGADSRPLPSPEIDLIAAWLDTHPALETATDAVSAPGYRSSLPGLSSAADFDAFASAGFDRVWTEPRLAPNASRDYALFLGLRARVAAARGDIPAAAADCARLHRLAATAAQTPTLIGALWVRIFLQLPVTDFSAWPDEDLSALAAGARAVADDLESRRPGVLAGELMCSTRLTGHPALPRPFDRTPAFLAPYTRWLELADWNARLRDALDADLSPDPVAAVVRICLDPDAADSFSDAFAFVRVHADFLATAVAVERFRRARGALPAELGELVPDFLPAVPRSPWDGAPFAYSPVPREFPAETRPALATLDELLLTARAQNPGAPKRTLPPLALPGYTLTAPVRPASRPRPVFFPRP